MIDCPDLVECNANVIFSMNSEIDRCLDFQMHSIWTTDTSRIRISLASQTVWLSTLSMHCIFEDTYDFLCFSLFWLSDVPSKMSAYHVWPRRPNTRLLNPYSVCVSPITDTRMMLTWRSLLSHCKAHSIGVIKDWLSTDCSCFLIIIWKDSGCFQNKGDKVIVWRHLHPLPYVMASHNQIIFHLITLHPLW